jgi:aryl-alcohol dehydrogenase-like predicted oxidoreductase
MLTRRLALQLGLGATAAALVCDPLRAKSYVIHTRPIPSSGEKLPLIGIGTARRFDVQTADEKAPLREVLRELPNFGGTLVDTAPSYGVAEAGLAEMTTSLERLKRIDLMQIHNLAGVEVMLPILREWKDAKRIRYYGISTSSDQQYDALEAIMKREKLDFIQIDYAIDNRFADERILPLAADRGMAVLTNLPFGRGRVLSAFQAKDLPDWAKELGIETWAQFALKWVVSHPAVTSAIPGTAKLAYLKDNLGAGRGPMPDAATRKKMAALIA